ncbi:MAG: type IV secretion protein DotI [Gammaproteobacteria bacterium RIFCSPHIGHO2_12_FULL_42_13]|nr:MAG: type IV secretion protein DotI [Gammaproteobacteria bacterium RIFCSPHIGHO2_12_FULL_42_13]
MAEDAIEAVRLRNDFYRDNHRKVMIALLVAILLIVMLSGVLTYVVTHPPPPKYFATSTDGRIIPLIPLSQPNMPTSALLLWANQAATAAFTYDFVNYRQALQAASDYFTSAGWRDFLNALTSSNNLSAVLTKKLVVSSTATAAPVVLQQGELNGVYAWRVQLPMVITYQSASQVAQQNVLVTMLVTRVSTLNSARGVGISQFVVSSANT